MDYPFIEIRHEYYYSLVLQLVLFLMDSIHIAPVPPTIICLDEKQHERNPTECQEEYQSQEAEEYYIDQYSEEGNDDDPNLDHDEKDEYDREREFIEEANAYHEEIMEERLANRKTMTDRQFREWEVSSGFGKTKTECHYDIYLKTGHVWLPPMVSNNK